MKSKTIFSIFFALMIFFSLTCVVAEDSSNSTVIDNSVLQVNNVVETDICDDGALADSEGSLENSKVIYVGSNDGKGDGSYENPYSTFKSACDNVNGENSVTIKVFNGTYYLGEGLEKDSSTPLIFNTNNLNIEGISGEVIIKNFYNDNDEGLNAEAFQLASGDANFTFSNLIFDTTECGVQPFIDGDMLNYFFPFYGDANLGTYKNCSFIGFYWQHLNDNQINSNFIGCTFDFDLKNYDKINLFDNPFPKTGTIQKFEYCIFKVPVNVGQMKVSHNMSIDSPWFGENQIKYTASFTNSDGTYNRTHSILNKYAIFSVSQKYLGDNQYEILGKLTWNGTDNQDGMENFQPMTVNLVSTTGDINQTATLVNGNFRAIYISSATNHKVTATLDNEEIELEFNTVNITADPVSIYYGEDQNITFNFTQPITANVTVTVSNGSYNKTEKVEVTGKDSLVYTVPDTLKEGIYNVEISLDGNNLFGSNSTTLTVSKVSDYTFNIDIQDNGNVKVGDDVVITVELPEDVSGNVTVKVNDNPEIIKEATPNTVITINNLIGGNNNITIAYTGNDKYAAKTSEPQVVTAQKASAPDGDNALNITAPADSATPTYSINMPKDATGNLTVIVDGKDKYTKELVNGSATITLPELSAGKHDINVTYTGDAKYESISKTTSVNIPAKSTPAKKPVAKKAATKITAKKKTFKAKKKVKKYTITLKSGKKPVKKVWVTLKIKGKKLLKAKTNAKGKATFKIKKLTKKGKYNAVIKFKGNKNYKASSKKVKITIKK